MILSLVALVAALAEPPSPGFYRSNQIEVAAALAIEPDGTFEYALDYGAVSEMAEGKWSIADGTLVLTATRMEGAVGAPKFDRQAVRQDGRALLLDRYGKTIRFELDGDPGDPPNRNHQLERKDADGNR